MEGMKFDEMKDRFDLLLPEGERLAAQVLTLGALKYDDDNWKKVSPRRYEAAILRHINAWRSGEIIDDESGLPHLAHARTCLDFLIWFDLQRYPNTIKCGQGWYRSTLERLQKEKIKQINELQE